MLGKYGETLVVDWGLAKSVGRPEAAPASATLDDRTLVPESGSDLRGTEQGDAAGDAGLHEPGAGRRPDRRAGPGQRRLLAGRDALLPADRPRPVRAIRTLAELLPKVERGDFAPPRQLQGWIDPALEAICLKAMTTDPAQRYATPRALADDVEHWLADEPVGAYAEPVTARAKRWMRQHPSRVTAAAVLLLSTVVGLTIGTVLLNRSNRLLEQSNLLLDEQRQLAEKTTRRPNGSAKWPTRCFVRRRTRLTPT